MQKMQMIGNLTRDPELRTTADGTAVCNFTVAVNKPGRNGHPEADYFRVAAWRQLGERCAQYLAKGRKVYVEGPLTVRLYQANNGETKTELNVSAAQVEFLSPRERGGEAPMTDAESGYQEVSSEDVPF